MKLSVLAVLASLTLAAAVKAADNPVPSTTDRPPVETTKPATSPSATPVPSTTAAAAPEGHVVLTPERIVWREPPPGLPKGAEMAVLSGDPAKAGLFAVRFKLPAGTKIAPHWHPADENITVLSGTLKMGHGDVFKSEGAMTMPVGAFSVMPAKVHHFAWCDEATEIQLNAIGPWGITYVNPADDPRIPKAPAKP